jgi:hypothetical protein
MCGYVPASEVTFMQCIGMLFLRRAKTLRIRACRDCGRALFRRTQSLTLLTGWWGMISAVTNIAYLWGNFKERRTLDALGEPRPPRERTTQTPRTSPLPIGTPTLLRPQSLAFVAIVVAVVLFFTTSDPSSSGSPPALTVGACGSHAGTQVQYPVDCTDGLANARVVAILPATSGEADCPRTTDGVTHSERYGIVCWDSL